MNLSRVLDIETEYATNFLVEKLKENKKLHQEEFIKATEEYLKVRKEKAEKLASVATEVMNDPKGNNGDKVFKAFQSLNGLLSPVDATEMYDQYISLFEKSSSSTIKLSLSDANAIIHDKWDWAVSAKLTNTSYFSSTR